MPRTLRLRDGSLHQMPFPLDNAPVARALKDHAGEKYLVFVDETFFSFFGLETPHGYLCYGTVGIPEREYDHYKRAVGRIFEQYEAYVVGDSGTHLKEFKFEDFKRLSHQQREDTASQMGKALKMYGGFIAGYFTHVCGVVMERVRSNLVGESHAVPLDHKSLYDNAAAELRNELAGVAQSKTIAKILAVPFSGHAHFLSFFGCPFQFICDPRESKEDRAVLAAIDDFFTEYMARLAPDEASLYKGMDNTRSSESEIGVQIADLIAGEVRSLFEAHPRLLTEGSTLELIDMESREDGEWWQHFAGVYQKLGSMTKISSDLLQALNAADGTNCLPLYRHSLGKL